MNRLASRFFRRTLASAVCAALVVPLSIQAKSIDEPGAQRVHDLEHPLGKERRALRKAALEERMSGKGKGKVHRVAKGQYVELEREGEDPIWTVLGEFGAAPPSEELQQYAAAIDPDNTPISSLPGPVHNVIPEPNRDVNNATHWVANFNRSHYLDMLFADADGANSMRNYYIEQSSGRYAVYGDVTDWAMVPGNGPSYGHNALETNFQAPGGAGTWRFVADTVNAWYDRAMNEGGMSVHEINAYLSEYDVWDRYDYDGDGNFDEPDGYIDHFQAVHAEEGEEAGGGSLGADAIWSHRWYAFWTNIGFDGPQFNPIGGIRIGDSDYWIGDYTVEPENGGVGVFAHEFGHDHDLPDLYNTAGGPSNSTGHWTLMSAGSWTSDGTVDIGTKPTHMGAWEKLQLGWLNYDVAVAGKRSSHKLGPAETNTKQAQALIVALPDIEVVAPTSEPYEGERMYFSGEGNDLNNSMVKGFDLPAESTLTAKVFYDIEEGWDFAFLVASVTPPFDDPGTYFPVATNLGIAMTGASGGWIDLIADLSAFTGPVALGFAYQTDNFVSNPGLTIDNIQVNGGPVMGAEEEEGFVLDGFTAIEGEGAETYFNAYIAEFRQYMGYDKALQTGPYIFDPYLFDWVNRYPYQDGLLISYWNTSVPDNNTSVHPGTGLILPIDAHNEVMYWGAGGDEYQFWNTIQTYDSTFSLEPTDAFEVPFYELEVFPSKPGVSVFDDNLQYWNPERPTMGVMNPHTGTKIEIKSVSAKGTFMNVLVSPSK